MKIIFGPKEAHGVPEMGQKSPEAPTRVGARPTPVGAPSILVAASWLLRLHLQVSWLSFGPRKIIANVSFRLYSVWYSFSAKLKNKEKIGIGTTL